MWRSVLYPETWRPGDPDEQGRFLHDFSYAGYRRGSGPIPDDPPGRRVDATRSPYFADSTGARDATAALQRALDDVGGSGGGIVYLPAGTYRVRPRGDRPAALHLAHSNVVLRGAGPAATFVYNDETAMRSRQVLRVAPHAEDVAWHAGEWQATAIAADLAHPTCGIPVADVYGYAPGDWIVLRGDATEAWIAAHGMTGKWAPAAPKGPQLYRRVLAVDAGRRALVVDAPTRYPLLRRDNARVHKVAPHLSEVGIERLAIGMREILPPDGAPVARADVAPDGYEHVLGRIMMGRLDCIVPGTTAYAIHGSQAIVVNHVVDGWIRDVATYRPPANTQDVHLLSNGIVLRHAACVSVERVIIGLPQYLGEGGNGYALTLAGNDCLVTDSELHRARHCLSFMGPQTSGNVVVRTNLRASLYPSDFHMHLSVANLLDSVTLDRDCLHAAYRAAGTVEHGQTTSQSVVWNVRGLRPQRRFDCAAVSQQFGWGYVIGTSGPISRADAPGGHGTEPVDHVEGVGEGDTLSPHSLYADQVHRRLAEVSQ
jgi:hypothetical protein